MKELDLSLCKDINTQIHYAIKNNTKLNKESITNFQEKGIDIFNLKDKFFNDLCYSYSDSNNDMTLEDRIKYLYQNYSLCEEGCTYNSIDLKNMNIACNCKIQSNDNTTSFNMTTLVYEQPKDIGFFDSNIGVVKCYKLVFSLNNKLNNIGFLIFIIIFFLYIIFIICLCVNGIKPVKNYLFIKMKEKGYISTIKSKRIEITKSEKKIKEKRNNKFDKLTNCLVPIIKTKKSIYTRKKNYKSNKKSKRRYSTKNVATKNIIITGINININNNNNQYINYNQIKKNNENQNNNENRNNEYKNNNKYKNNYNKYKNDNIQNSEISCSKSKIINLKKSKKNKKNKIVKIIENDDNNFGIIKIDLNDIKNYFPQESNQSLHNYTFDEATKYDKRNILRIAYIYLLSKQIIFKTIFQKSPLELFPLRFILFIFMLSCDLALNALFYFNDNISKKYHYAQNIFLFAFTNQNIFLFAFTNNITIIIYSTLLSYFLITLLSKLSNSSSAIREVFQNVENKIMFKPKFKINEQLKKNVNLQIEKILRYSSS